MGLERNGESKRIPGREVVVGDIIILSEGDRVPADAIVLANKALYAIIAFNVAILGLVIYVPFLRDLFHFGPLHPNDLGICLGAGIVCIIWFELVKYFSVIKAVPAASQRAD